jgi:membrane-associated phospholipid phosphatase
MNDRLYPDNKPWDIKLAKLITNLINPPLVAGVGVFILAAWLGGGAAYYWAIFFVFVVVAMPTLYTIWLLKRGKIEAFFLPKRENRIRVIVAMVITNTIGVLVMVLGKAPFIMIAFGAVGILQAAMILLITLYWKISAHMIGIAGLSAFMAIAFGGWGTLALVMIPLVAWARLQLGSHSFSQVFGGILLGGGFIGTATWLIAYFCGGIGLTCGCGLPFMPQF